METRYHQGYLLTGDMEKGLSYALKTTSELLGTDESGLSVHPDYSFLQRDLLSVKDAREIRERSSARSFEGKGRVFVVRADFFSGEAENALLKTFEEPAGLCYFFLVTSSTENILPTLRSRLVNINFYPSAELSDQKREFVTKFLSLGPDSRLKLVKKIYSDPDKEKLMDIFNGLEVVLRDNLLKEYSTETVKCLEDIGNHREYLFMRAPSLRMILDYLVYVLPKT